MSARNASRIGVGSLVACVLLYGLGLPLELRAPAQDLPLDERSTAELEVVFAVVLLVFTAVGALIVARRPRHPVGWLLLATGVISALAAFASGYGLQATVTDPGSLPGGEWAAWASSWLDSATMGSVILLLLLFPDGRLTSRRWRLAVWLTGAAMVAVIADLMFTPGRLYGFETIDNPAGIDAASWLRDFDATGPAMILFVAAVAGLLVKRRRASAEVRLQLKWFLFAASLLAVVLVFAAIFEALVPSENRGSDVIGGIVFAVVFGLLAGSVGLAVLKYRLYDIDVVINRTLVYAALTATLAAAYIGTVLLLQLVLSPGSDLAIAASTLAVAALFRPARRRIQALVDRRFYRRRYDAQRTLESFGIRLRDQVELDSLSAELRGVAAETMQPSHVSVWLRAER